MSHILNLSVDVVLVLATLLLPYSRSSLRALSLTCKAIYDVCIKVMLKTVIIRRHRTSAETSFAHLALRHPDLMRHARHLSLQK